MIQDIYWLCIGLRAVPVCSWGITLTTDCIGSVRLTTTAVCVGRLVTRTITSLQRKLRVNRKRVVRMMRWTETTWTCVPITQFHCPALGRTSHPTCRECCVVSTYLPFQFSILLIYLFLLINFLNLIKLNFIFMLFYFIFLFLFLKCQCFSICCIFVLKKYICFWKY